MTVMNLRLIREPEKEYCREQSRQIREQTGCLGHLEMKLVSGRGAVSSVWKGYGDGPETKECREEAERVADVLMFGDMTDGVMKGRELLAGNCFARRGDLKVDAHSYRFRIDTEKHAYLAELSQYYSGKFLLSCQCYRRDRLDGHLKDAAKGIRFTDSAGREKFVLPDGGTIRIRYPDGRVREEPCRYVDPFHAEIGPGPMNLFRMRVFAEAMEQELAVVKPVDRMPAGKEAAR